MQETYTPADRVSAAHDALAAVMLTMMTARHDRHERRAHRAAVRAQRRADRAFRLALRGGVGAAESPRV